MKTLEELIFSALSLNSYIFGAEFIQNRDKPSFYLCQTAQHQGFPEVEVFLRVF